MKKIIIATLLTLTSLSTFAAKFKYETKLKSAALEELGADVEKLIAQHLVDDKTITISSDVQDIFRISFVRKPQESNISTVKQYAIGKLGQYPDDEMGETASEIKSKNPQEIIDNLLYTFIEFADSYEEQDLATVKSLHSELTEKVSSLLKRSDASQISFYSGNHSDEDGTWGILILVDEKTQEILSLKLGFSGT